MAEATSSIVLPTRTMRGMGANYDTDHATQSSISLSNLKWNRIPWSFVDNETITPGEGKVPRGAVVMFTEALADNDPASVYFDLGADPPVGTVATDGSTHLGYLIVGSRRR